MDVQLTPRPACRVQLARRKKKREEEEAPEDPAASGKDALSISGWFVAHVSIALKVAQLQFIVRVLDTLAVSQRWVRTVQTAQQFAEIPQVQFLGVVVCAPVGVQRLVPVVLTARMSVVRPPLQSIANVVDILAVAERGVIPSVRSFLLTWPRSVVDCGAAVACAWLAFCRCLGGSWSRSTICCSPLLLRLVLPRMVRRGVGFGFLSLPWG